jgi:hypothetical protein
VSVEFSGARAVIDASRCALDREYSKRDHTECEWCVHVPAEIVKSVWMWIRNPANAAEISKEDRGEEQLW